MTSARPTQEEAGPLAHALCARLAEDLGVRVLAIKGPVLAQQGLRAPRVSADVDVWVHPDEAGRFVTALLDLGWHESPEYTGPRILASHSTDVLHDQWPVGIDVHHLFPGYLADPATVFEELWSRRVEVELAGVPVPTLDPVAHAGLTALHLLRYDPRGGTPALQDLARRTREVLGGHGGADPAGPADLAVLADLADLARRTRADWPMRPFLLDLGVGEEELTATPPDGYDDWLLFGDAPPAMPWLMHLASLPARAWPRALWEAVMLPEDQLRSFYGPQGLEESVGRLRWRRLRRGAQELPGAARAYLRARRDPRADVAQGARTIDDDRRPRPNV